MKAIQKSGCLGFFSTLSCLVFLVGCSGGSPSAPPPPVGNLVPTVSAVSPANITAGASAASITVSGNNFVAGAAVNLDAIQLTTQFVSSTQLTASVPSSTQILAGTHVIKVTNPSPGGGPSATSAQLTITPSLAAVTPTGATVGSSVSITIYGGDVSTPANDILTFTQAGRTFTVKGTAATASGGAVSVAVTVPAGLVPATAAASLAAPATLSTSVNSIASNNTLPFQVQPPAHALGISPSSAEPGTSVGIVVVGSFTAFDSNSTVTADDPGLSLSNASINSPHLITATLTVSNSARPGDHLITATSAGSTIVFHFTVLAASPGPVSLTGLSATAGPPLSPITISGSGFAAGGQIGTSVVVRYQLPGLVVEVPVAAHDDTRIDTLVPILPDLTTGNFYRGVVAIQVVVNGKLSNSLSLSVLPLPPNSGTTGATTLIYLDTARQQLIAEKDQLASTPGLPQEQATAIGTFLDAVDHEIARVRDQVSTAANGGTVIAPDGSSFTKDTVDLFDRFLQASSVLSTFQSTSHQFLRLAASQFAAPSTTDQIMAASGATCKATDVFSDISDVLDAATSVACFASLEPLLAPVFGPVCGFLKALDVISFAVTVVELACDVLPVNLRQITAMPETISTFVNGPSYTEGPLGTFSSSAATNTTETLSGLLVQKLLERSHLNKRLLKGITDNKIFISFVDDVFQDVFSEIYKDYVETSGPVVFFFANANVPLTSDTVSLLPSPNGFADFNGLAVIPKDKATTGTKLYFDTSAFRSLDSQGQVTLDSTQVLGNAVSLIIMSVVQVSPAAQTASPGAQVQFSATVVGVGPVLQGVSWSVDDISGGNSAVGTISTTGVYTAPIAPGNHTIKATSQFDGSVGLATVTVPGAIPAHVLTVASSNPNSGSAISVSPADNNGQSNGTTQFLRIYDSGVLVSLGAAATAAGNNFANWTGCDSTSGAVCTLTMNADRTIIANYGTRVAISPQTAVVPVGGVQTFTATVTGTSNVSVTWSIAEGAQGGSITYGIHPYDGIYTPPGSAGTFHIVATAQADPSAQATAVVTVTSALPFTVLHSFSGADGSSPFGKLIKGTDDKFYGSTQSGGTNGLGTLFSIDIAGNLTLLHSFTGTDGFGPTSALIQVNGGDFYGVSPSAGYGTLFRISSSGNFTNVHFFSSSEDSGPYSGIIQASDGFFYGTSQTGGANGGGTVFRVDTSGSVVVLHSFRSCSSGGDLTDGCQPVGGLMQGGDGNFYGTTSRGGINGQGTIFRMDSGGQITILHAFNFSDGSSPLAPMIQAKDGFLYGTAFSGGPGTNAGEVFKVDLNGNFSVVHAFDGPDGFEPETGLLEDTDGYFYGITLTGGVSSSSLSLGVIYRIDAQGNVTVLHSFDATQPGSYYPRGGIVRGSDGNLYGVAQAGGANQAGVVFKLAHP